MGELQQLIRRLFEEGNSDKEVSDILESSDVLIELGHSVDIQDVVTVVRELMTEVDSMKASTR